MMIIWSLLRPCIITNKQAKKRLAADLYLLKKGWDFINISNNRSPSICYKISGKDHSSLSGIKVILLQAPLVYFLLTELFPRMFGGGRFYDMTNYALEPLAILEIYRDTIQKTYIWFENVKKNLYLLDI